MKKLALAIVLAFSLAGCSTAQQANLNMPVNSLADFLSKFGNITVQDAQTALADVHAHGDVDLAALSCYPAIIEFVQNPAISQGLAQPTIDGILSANQLKRDVIISGLDKNSPLQIAVRKLHVGCAAYAGDEARWMTEFMVMIGAASHGAPSLPVGGLPLR